MAPIISYAQRYEDMHLLRAFGEQASGFYIDIGAGHPVYDNVSFAFYLRGWRGITVEPNPWLAQLSEAVRPLDVRIQSLVGEKPGERDLLSGRGFPRTVDHDRKPRPRRTERIRQALAGDDHAGHDPASAVRATCPGRASTSSRSTSRAPSARCSSAATGGASGPRSWSLEALAPVTMAPAWEAWEPLLTGSGYRYAFFDSLNRYYVAEEHAALAERLAAAPASFDGVTPFRQFKPALDDAAHPDHGLARLLGGADMVRLPLMSFDTMAERLINGLDPADPDRPVQPSDIAAAHQRLFGMPATPAWAESLHLAADATIRDLYRSAVATRRFRAACGRISASSAW